MDDTEVKEPRLPETREEKIGWLQRHGAHLQPQPPKVLEEMSDADLEAFMAAVLDTRLPIFLSGWSRGSLTQEKIQELQNFLEEWPAVLLQGLDTVLEVMRSNVELIEQQVKNLDTKANLLLGSITVLTATAAALQTVVRGSLVAHISGSILWLFAAVTCLVYAALLACTYMAYFPRSYHVAGPPKDLKILINADPLIIKTVLFVAMEDAIQKNYASNENKAMWTKRALRIFVLQIAWLLLLLMVSLWAVQQDSSVQGTKRPSGVSLVETKGTLRGRAHHPTTAQLPARSCWVS